MKFDPPADDRPAFDAIRAAIVAVMIATETIIEAQHRRAEAKRLRQEAGELCGVRCDTQP